MTAKYHWSRGHTRFQLGFKLSRNPYFTGLWHLTILLPRYMLNWDIEKKNNEARTFYV